MPSTWSSRFRLNYQAPGESLNTWGGLLNTQVFQLLEDAVAKRVAFSLSGSKTLTTANGANDEARCAFLDVTSGTGGTITAPPLEKIYLVRNASSGDVIVTTGAGTTATIVSGETSYVVCDASNFRKVRTSDFGGARITSVGTPTAAGDATNKGYVDGLAFGAVNLPGQGPGSVGAALFSDGAVASWRDVEIADVNGGAPINAPSFTGGVTIAGGGSFAGGLDVAGSTKANVAAVASTSIDLATADFFTKSISSNTTFTFANATASRGQAFTIELTISSAAVPSWPASVDYPGGPSANPSASLGNGRHLLGFITYNGGVDWTMILLARAAA